MTPLRKVVVWALATVAVFLAVIAIYLGLQSSQAPIAEQHRFRIYDALFPLAVLGMTFVGALVTSRTRRNPLGWIFLVAGLGAAIALFANEYVVYSVLAYPGSLPSPDVVDWLGRWVWVPGEAGIFLMFLLFPNGRLLSRRWRAGAVTVVASGAVLTFGQMFTPGSFEDAAIKIDNPFGLPGVWGKVALAARDFGNPLLLIGFIIAAISIGIRLRRSRGEERAQIRMLAYSVAIAALGASWTPVSLILFPESGTHLIPAFIGMALIPIAAGIAILKYRLYDIDVVINKTFVYFSLAAFIGLIYVGLVVGVGSLVGAGDEPNLGLSLAATAVVAVAFQPVRERIQRLANRVVYGQRLSPYEAVTSFSHRMAESLSFDEVLPSVAEAAASAVGGERSKVTLIFPQGGSQEIAWPAGTDPTHNSFDATVEVIHQGTQVGEISVAKKKGEALTQSEQKLLNDLASQAGLAFSNLRLTEELKAKLVELQESRRRIVSAQDEERRRMERDIHDGAQQQLVSMSVKLSLARSLVAKDPKRASLMLDELRGETSEAVETLRDLARGLMPALLSERGVLAAVESHLHKSGLAASVVDQTGGARFPSEIESNLYFVIREALQNASKHAGGSSIVVSLTASDQELRFEVSDGGPGFDPSGAKMGSGLQNMADRIEAIGGRLEIASEPGAGARVFGRVSSGRDGDQARAIERKGT